MYFNWLVIPLSAVVLLSVSCDMVTLETLITHSVFSLHIWVYLLYFSSLNE